MNKTRITAADIRLVKQTNTGDEIVYRAFMQHNSECVGTVIKGWTRVGGQGWVVIRKDEASSLTKKSLGDCRTYIADRETKKGDR